MDYCNEKWSSACDWKVLQLEHWQSQTCHFNGVNIESNWQLRSGRGKSQYIAASIGTTAPNYANTRARAAFWREKWWLFRFTDRNMSDISFKAWRMKCIRSGQGTDVVARRVPGLLKTNVEMSTCCPDLNVERRERVRFIHTNVQVPTTHYPGTSESRKDIVPFEKHKKKSDEKTQYVIWGCL